jgi:DNA polymerase-3 subunit alpha
MLLNCHTYYSFKYGTLPVERLLAEIKQKGYRHFVLSDINNTSACISAIAQAAELGLNPIMGIDFRNGIKQQYIGIARNNAGFEELNNHLSIHLHQAESFQPQAPTFNNAYIIYPFTSYNGWSLKDNEYVGIHAKDLNKISFNKKINERKLVVLHSATFAEKKGFHAHRLLRAIDLNSLLSMLPVGEQTTPDEVILPKDELYFLFRNYPQIIQNTERILHDCHIHISFGKFANKNLKHYTQSVHDDVVLLRSLCSENLAYRYPKITNIVSERLEKELEIIGQMNFSSYFLINWDIVKYAQHKNYYYVGRGSGANSLVAYLLRITDVDPIGLDLYFERFINPFRSTPPDFDIDFSWTDRDDITEYIFNSFGNNQRTALLGAYNTFQFNAISRELGKVFGLPPSEIDKLQSNPDPSKTDDIGRLILRYGQWLEGFPNHLSIHSSGIIISNDPITCYTATFMPPKGFPTTHFSMIEAEDIGLYKFDILSQRGLGKIKDALSIIKQNKKVEIDIHDAKKFMADEQIKMLLREGKTIGCFYVESPAMRMLLCKLKADDYLRLVAASSIIRPGVSKSGMMREYILRFRNPELRKKARDVLPELYDILEETYGVMVYQEDVIKVAHSFAGLSLAEADYLRRGMSWKFKQRNEFSRVREQFFHNCAQKNYPIKTVNEVWNQIESFANFAFSKGHSASYAVESYQALYLKAHFPIEYMVATLNNGGGFYRNEIYIHEARMYGAVIHNPCVNKSDHQSCLYDKDVYLGFSMIHELGHQLAEDIIKERNINGHYTTLYNFIKRVSVSIEQLRLLIRSDCFAYTKKDKRALLWEAHLAFTKASAPTPRNELFEEIIPEYKLPAFANNHIDAFYDQIELLGFPPCLPFDIIEGGMPIETKAKELKKKLGQMVSIVGYLVITKKTGTSGGERMSFGTFLDKHGDWIDTVHFPPSLKEFPFNGPGCYLLTGKVTLEFDFLTLEVSKSERLAYINQDDL